MSLINIINLGFGYSGANDIFDNVNLSLDSNWRLGLVGANGRGKTTLLKLFLGEYKYSGTISHSLKFDYFPFKVDESKLCIDIVNELADCELWQIERELNLLRLNEDCLLRPFSSLSKGEQIKLMLATLFIKQDNFLLIDEPINHLDHEGRQIVSQYLSKKRSFIIVSHDKAFLDGCVDHILSINKGNIELMRGNLSVYLHNKQLRDEFEQSQNQRLQREIDRLENASKRKTDWSKTAERAKYASNQNAPDFIDRGFIGAKASKSMKTAKSLQKRQERQIEQKSSLLKNIETTRPLKITELEHHSKCLIEAIGLSQSYGNRSVFKDLSFTIEQGQRVWLRGKNGCGKTSLIKVILGEIEGKGELKMASNLKISYISQDTAALRGGLFDFAKTNELDLPLFINILTRLGVNQSQFDTDISGFSDGQKKKVLIARSLSKPAHIYIWDEPLNYIDIMSRLQIEELIKQFEPTLLFIEHDVSFSQSVATDILDL